MASKTTIRKQTHRARLFREQRGLCFYCGDPMLLASGCVRGKRPPRKLATLDHIVPLASAGPFAPSINAVAACFECNQQRGTKDARLFMLEKQGAI